MSTAVATRFKARLLRPAQPDKATWTFLLLPAAALPPLLAAYLVAVKRGYPAGTFPGWEIVWISFKASVPGLAVVVIIIAGILSGAFTATESASVAVVWALFLTAIVYRRLTREQFLKAAAKAVKTTGTVLLLIGISSMFGYLIGLYGVAELFLGFTGLQPGVAHFAHLGGMLFGWLVIRYWRGQPPFKRRPPGPPKRPNHLRSVK